MSADNIDGNILELTSFRKERDRIIKADNPQGLIKGIDQITYRFCLNRLISAMAFTCVGYGNSQLTKKTTLDENKAEIDFIDGQNVSDIEDYLNDKSDYHDHTEEVGFREPEKIKSSNNPCRPKRSMAADALARPRADHSIKRYPSALRVLR